MKYIFVTGGVVSAVGKGLTAASLGALLEESGYRVRLQKFDPYLNVDPGTMNPYQHGEVYVLDDGTECDLDLGHYERFTSLPLSRQNSMTAGQVYETLISRERRGDFLGQTVQVIPHVTGVIKDRLRSSSADCDILITEVGGTVGDIEGLPFLEAIRQWGLDVGRDNVCYLHVSLIPYVAAAGELKSKPTQMSVAQLRQIGIMADAIICRCDRPLEDGMRQKLSLFCNVEPAAIIEEVDVQDSIYEVPQLLAAQGLDQFVLRRLGLPPRHTGGHRWQEIVRRVKAPQHSVQIAIVGKYMELSDAYKSVFESLAHAGIANDTRVELVKIDAEAIEQDGPHAHLSGVAGILVPGGFGHRGIEGKILAAQYARENSIPYLGLCLGLQIAAIEFARHVLGLSGANSTEFDPNTPHPVVYRMPEQEGVTSKGATMRLGSYRCALTPDTRAAAAYGQVEVRERHRHRYEFNSALYGAQYQAAGMRVAGINPERNLVEILELTDHPFFVGVQFHPEFLSKPTAPHPLFSSFVATALELSQSPTATLAAG